VIFVPDKDPSEKRDVAALILQTTQVITSVIGVVILSRQF
jgi:hypothetical protein